MCQQFAVSHVLWHIDVRLPIFNVPKKNIEYCQKANKEDANAHK